MTHHEESKTGGPAFPYIDPNYRTQGMSLRDYLAGQALTAIITADKNVLPDDAAIQSLSFADAVLKHRGTP